MIAKEFAWEKAPLTLKNYVSVKEASPQKAGELVAAVIEQTAT